MAGIREGHVIAALYHHLEPSCLQSADSTLRGGSSLLPVHQVLQLLSEVREYCTRDAPQRNPFETELAEALEERVDQPFEAARRQNLITSFGNALKSRDVELIDLDCTSVQIPAGVSTRSIRVKQSVSVDRNEVHIRVYFYAVFCSELDELIEIGSVPSARSGDTRLGK